MGLTWQSPIEEHAMKIALTGATGFLGRYIAIHLAGTGHHLRAWYRQGSDRSGFGVHFALC